MQTTPYKSVDRIPVVNSPSEVNKRWVLPTCVLSPTVDAQP